MSKAFWSSDHLDKELATKRIEHRWPREKEWRTCDDEGSALVVCIIGAIIFYAILAFIL